MNTKELKTVDTNFDKAEQGLRIYCSRHLGKIFNPFSKDIYRDFSREEIDLSLDFLTHVLRKEIDEPRLQELDEKFYSAFEQYLTTSRLYFGSVLNGIEGLSSLFEPFLKKAYNPMITKYLDIDEFKNFSLYYGNIIWNDHEMCFPINNIYNGKIN